MVGWLTCLPVLVRVDGLDRVNGLRDHLLGCNYKLGFLDIRKEEGSKS